MLMIKLEEPFTAIQEVSGRIYAMPSGLRYIESGRSGLIEEHTLLHPARCSSNLCASSSLENLSVNTDTL